MHTLEKTVVLPPLTDPRQVCSVKSLLNSIYTEELVLGRRIFFLSFNIHYYTYESLIILLIARIGYLDNYVAPIIALRLGLNCFPLHFASCDSAFIGLDVSLLMRYVSLLLSFIFSPCCILPRFCLIIFFLCILNLFLNSVQPVVLFIYPWYVNDPN